MPDEQPRYFTGIDLFWELVLVGFVTTGCYVGWQLRGHLLAMFAGGVVGRGVGLALLLSIRSWVIRSRDV